MKEKLNVLSRKIIQNILKGCQQEKDANRLQAPLQQVVKRAANYAGVHASTCLRWRNRNPVGNPSRPRPERIKVDSFDREVIRRTVHDMIKSKKLPTLHKIHSAIKQRISFPGKIGVLRRVLKEMGFTWQACSSNRRLLMERTDIVNARIEFLRKMREFRKEGRPIIYTDETFIHTTHCMKRCWQSKEAPSNVPFNKGERLIVVHAGHSGGFIPGALLMFKAHSSSGDYHSEMNGTNFFKWLNEMLVPNLPPDSVVVVDNAPYHNLQTDKRPTQATKKADVQAWLQRNGISFTSTMLKAELLELCKKSHVKPNYILDSTLRQHGHTCLRLPQYHAELNAIELIWAYVKRKIADLNVTYKMQDVLKLAVNIFDDVPTELWASCCNHVENVESAFWKTDVIVEEKIEQLIIYVSDEDGTDSASEVENNNSLANDSNDNSSDEVSSDSIDETDSCTDFVDDATETASDSCTDSADENTVYLPNENPIHKYPDSAYKTVMEITSENTNESSTDSANELDIDSATETCAESQTDSVDESITDSGEDTITADEII